MLEKLKDQLKGIDNLISGFENKLNQTKYQKTKKKIQNISNKLKTAEDIIANVSSEIDILSVEIVKLLGDASIRPNQPDNNAPPPPFDKN